MFKKDRIYEDLSPILKRVRVVFYVLGGLLALILGYYWKVQILDHQKYWQLAESNRLRERALPAPRGVITERNGKIILANNTAGFKVSIIRENIKDFEASYRNISHLLGIDEADIKARIEKYGSVAAFQPIVVKDNLTSEEVSRIEARKLEFPELEVEIEPKRSYPFGASAAHVLGYVQELSPEDFKTGVAGKRHWGDMAGRTGIERQYDDVLTGEDGRLLEIVDSFGRSRGEMAREGPRQGKSLRLSLDYDLQKKAEELLQDKEGTIVALDPKTGEVLALASFPTYDPNKFISRFTPEEWLSLINDPAYPLENRAIRGLYSPGSIFKIVMAAAGLDSGFVNGRTVYFCGGSQEIYGNVFSCWFKPGHGMMNLTNGIKNSCNVYFYNLGRRMGIEPIASYARLMGLGQKTGIDIPGEKEGLVPDPEWKLKTSKAPWYRGETISVSIGQGPLLVTPLQIADMVACVANRGVRIIPRLVFPEGGKEESGKTAVPIKRETFETVIQGMWMSVNDEGTGRGARVEGFDVCGKTGSTQWISTERADKLQHQGKEIKKTHSWFAGFAPRSDPKIVVTVLVEFGGSGGAAAAPLAGQFFDVYRKKYDR
ncbi:MAG: penicillin-binding protein 2 [Candidatus Aminicenantes bacterium]|nr:penicillin-binding protein 2 [Candidatus Aminicenantes bacterium]